VGANIESDSEELLVRCNLPHTASDAIVPDSGFPGGGSRGDLRRWARRLVSREGIGSDRAPARLCWMARLRAHSACASSHTPAATRAAPAVREIARPAGMTFSASTSIAIAAIHNTFITPPTNSNAMSTQQQPMQ